MPVYSPAKVDGVSVQPVVSQYSNVGSKFLRLVPFEADKKSWTEIPFLFVASRIQDPRIRDDS